MPRKGEKNQYAKTEKTKKNKPREQAWGQNSFERGDVPQEERLKGGCRLEELGKEKRGFGNADWVLFLQGEGKPKKNCYPLGGNQSDG